MCGHIIKTGMTDKEALAVCLRWKPFTMFDQGRPPKISFCDGRVYQVGFPGNLNSHSITV